MNVYQVKINDRNYSTWEIHNINSTNSTNSTNLEKYDLEMNNPIDYKLFSDDTFYIDEKKNVKILQSPIRSSEYIAGVFIIHGNKTYGRNSKGRLLYKCITNNPTLPSFLIPYEIKNVGFSKVFTNLYITFSFSDWCEKHPRGIIQQVIGPVDILDHFYEYQLYCKYLNISLQKFQKACSKALERNSHDVFIENMKINYPSIENRTNNNNKNENDNWFIFTIDPANTSDYDDGFSIRMLENDVQQVSIYISNVVLWIDILHLWESFSNRVSSIYLPNKKKPMLPTILSEGLCSLQSKVTRIAFYMDLFVKNNEIIDIQYGNCFVKVNKNFIYEESDLLINRDYLKLYDLIKDLSQKYKYIDNINNSNDLVAYLMVFMNSYCASELLKHKCGIFRSVVTNKSGKEESESLLLVNSIPQEVSKFIKIWNSSSGKYINGQNINISETIIRHDLLNIEAYIHITSPIRRMVDLLNMIKFQQIKNLICLSKNADVFFNEWINKLDDINKSMKNIRKIQNDCQLLDLCNSNSLIMEKEYDGYIFDKAIDNEYIYQFMVFIPELKMTSKIKISENLENFEMKKFKLYLFNDEENFKKKIRLQMM
jgi:exoribonuclease R